MRFCLQPSIVFLYERLILCLSKRTATPNVMQNYLVRLNLKTASQNFRIIWTVFAPKGLPFNHVGGAYEIYRQYIAQHPQYKFHSDFHDLDENSNVKDMAYAEEDEYGFEWGQLEIKSDDLGIQIVSIEPTKQEDLLRYVSDDHLNIQL